MSSSDEIAAEIARAAEEQLPSGIEVPSGLTEDEAVAWAIEHFKEQAGIDLPEDDVRAEVRGEDGRQGNNLMSC